MSEIVYICPTCKICKVCVFGPGKFNPEMKVIDKDEALAKILAGAGRTEMECRGCYSPYKYVESAGMENKNTT